MSSYKCRSYQAGTIEAASINIFYLELSFVMDFTPV